MFIDYKLENYTFRHFIGHVLMKRSLHRHNMHVHLIYRMILHALYIE